MKNRWCELSATSMSGDLSKGGKREYRKVEDEIGECLRCSKRGLVLETQMQHSKPVFFQEKHLHQNFLLHEEDGTFGRKQKNITLLIWEFFFFPHQANKLFLYISVQGRTH